ncbi:MAG TPA: amidohydrolase family protein [Candidatus Limnocylindria bacterium]|nr:amidohydrolase family protein [Candidatus Limnocylindria bacterium]
MSAYLFTNVRVVDGTGHAPFAGEVLVEGSRITAVTPGAAGPRPAGAARIDGGGATLMPGLVEPHAHLSFADGLSTDFTQLPVEEHMLVTVRNARTMLDSGYTSAFSAASAKPRLDVVLRNEIEAGRVPGPRLLANGPELTVTGGLGDTNRLHLPYNPQPTFAWVVDGPDDVRRACRTLAREGVDLLKLNLSGDQGTSSADSEETPMSDAEVAAAMEVARAARLRVVGHCRSGESVLMALRHGVEVINHANYADDRALDALEAARDRVFVVPALGITYNLAHADGAWGVTAERSRGFEHELAVSIDTVGRLRKRGIRVLPGGDYGFLYTPHGTYARDLWLYVEHLGFSPMETLVAATKHGGEIMGRPGELGVVKAGALADLLLVDGDPLADIAILQSRAALRMIMKDGVMHKAPA